MSTTMELMHLTDSRLPFVRIFLTPTPFPELRTPTRIDMGSTTLITEIPLASLQEMCRDLLSLKPVVEASNRMPFDSAAGDCGPPSQATDTE